MKKERYIPEGFKKTKETKLGVVYSAENFRNHKFCAMGFSGRSSKHDWYFSFSTKESMEKKITEYFEGLESHEKIKNERKEARKKELSEINVGDLFVSSWGWEQTNVDFYQCTEVKGKTFKIREIAGATVEGSMVSHGMACQVTPLKNNFLDIERHPEITKRSLKLNSYQWLSKTHEGSKHYKSWYG